MGGLYDREGPTPSSLILYPAPTSGMRAAEPATSTRKNLSPSLRTRAHWFCLTSARGMSNSSFSSSSRCRECICLPGLSRIYVGRMGRWPHSLQLTDNAHLGALHLRDSHDSYLASLLLLEAARASCGSRGLDSYQRDFCAPMRVTYTNGISNNS